MRLYSQGKTTGQMVNHQKMDAHVTPGYLRGCEQPPARNPPAGRRP